MNTHTSPELPSLDSREFAMVSSTASAVDANSPTRFRYNQRGALVWGEYVGDTARIGRFIGRRDGNTVTMRFGHVNAETGLITRGGATTEVAQDADGALRLLEDFDKDGQQHHSECVEVTDAFDWPTPSGAQPFDPSVNGVRFALESSTASTVNHDSPSIFDYNESDGLLWGEYRGDTVTYGFFVGQREGDRLNEDFVHHHIATDRALLGDSSTRVATRADGRLELIEDFVLDGVPGVSVCVQIAEG